MKSKSILDAPMEGHGAGAPVDHYLHAWVWQPNPNGMFADRDPDMHCPGA